MPLGQPVIGSGQSRKGENRPGEGNTLEKGALRAISR